MNLGQIRSYHTRLLRKNRWLELLIWSLLFSWYLNLRNLTKENRKLRNLYEVYQVRGYQISFASLPSTGVFLCEISLFTNFLRLIISGDAKFHRLSVKQWSAETGGPQIRTHHGRLPILGCLKESRPRLCVAHCDSRALANGGY